MKTVNVPSIRLSVLAAVLVVSLSGCSNLFTGNLFSGLDGPPSAGDITGRYVAADGSVPTDVAGDFVGDVEEAAESSRFFDDLSAGDRDDLSAALKDVYDNGAVDAETRQKAAILSGEVTLRDTPAGDTINNVADVLTSSGGADSFENPETLLDQIIPADAKGDPAAVQAILDDMVSAADAYNSLGGNLTDTDGDGSVDGPDGANMAETAQRAAVSMIVADLVGQTDSATLADAIANDSVDTLALTDPTGDATTGGTPLNNILQAGGLDGLFE